MLHAKKAGHIGTLDPFATGVLPMAFGEATKLIPYLEGSEKTYEFTLKFGTGTTTDDTEGEICAVSSHLPDAVAVNGIIPRFTGTISQIPPSFPPYISTDRGLTNLPAAAKNLPFPHEK